MPSPSRDQVRLGVQELADAEDEQAAHDRAEADADHYAAGPDGDEDDPGDWL